MEQPPTSEGVKWGLSGLSLTTLPHPFAEPLGNSTISHQNPQVLDPLHTQALSDAHGGPGHLLELGERWGQHLPSVAGTVSTDPCMASHKQPSPTFLLSGQAEPNREAEAKCWDQVGS